LPKYGGARRSASKGSSDLIEKKLPSELKCLLWAGDGVANKSESA
jgi:hypothetical protein